MFMYYLLSLITIKRRNKKFYSLSINIAPKQLNMIERKAKQAWVSVCAVDSCERVNVGSKPNWGSEFHSHPSILIFVFHIIPCNNKKTTNSLLFNLFYMTHHHIYCADPSTYHIHRQKVLKHFARYFDCYLRIASFQWVAINRQ